MLSSFQREMTDMKYAAAKPGKMYFGTIFSRRQIILQSIVVVDGWGKN